VFTYMSVASLIIRSLEMVSCIPTIAIIALKSYLILNRIGLAFIIR
jgi:hypothetical protein